MNGFWKCVRLSDSIVTQVNGHELRSSWQSIRHSPIWQSRSTGIQHPQRLTTVRGCRGDNERLNANKTRAIIRCKIDARGRICKSCWGYLHFEVGVWFLCGCVDDFAESIGVVTSCVVDEYPSGGGDCESDRPLVVVAMDLSNNCYARLFHDLLMNLLDRRTVCSIVNSQDCGGWILESHLGRNSCDVRAQDK